MPAPSELDNESGDQMGWLEGDDAIEESIVEEDATGPRVAASVDPEEVGARRAPLRGTG